VPRPTILDVAEKAGVGVGTVSRVLNNSANVRPETRKRVLAAIAALGFKPKSAARQLPRKTFPRNIGVITQPFINYYSFVERLRGVQRYLGEQSEDFELVLYNISSPVSFEKRVRFVAQTGFVEGLLVIDLELSDEQLSLLDSAHIPLVGLNQFADRTWSCFGYDNIQGGQLATNYLAELGHTRIAYVGDEFLDEFGFYTSSERFEGYKRALREHKLPVNDDLVWLGPYGYESAKALTTNLLAQPVRPTAIFAMSDMQALGCIAAIREAGLSVPEDISVMGYDNLEVSLHTGLTTINQHLDDAGYVGMQTLHRLIRGTDSSVDGGLPPLEVIVRQTTRPLQ